MATSSREREVQIVGRSAARRVAHGWIDLARAGTPRIGVLRGPAGIGRTTMLRAIVEDAELLDVTVLRATPPTRQGPPLLPVIEMLAPLIDQVRAGHRPDLLPADEGALVALVGGQRVDQGRGQQRRAGDETNRYLAVSRLVLGVARSRPLMLVVDDAHELDDASADLLAHLVASAAHAAEDVPVHLVTILSAIAPGPTHVAAAVIDRLIHEQGSAVLDLDGLDQLGLNELLAALGPAPPSRALLAAVAERTGGNPMLARQLWRLVLDDEQTRLVEGSVVAAPGVAERARVDLDDAVEALVAELSPPCRTLLTTAAVIGQRDRLDVLGAVTELDLDEVEELLSEAETAGVCRFDERHYEFRDRLLPTALARTVLPTRRRRLHRRIADALASIEDPPPLAVAHHLRLADDPDPDACRRWGELAAGQALATGAWGEAAAGFALALDQGAAGAEDPALRLGLCVEAAAAYALDHDQIGCERWGRRALVLAQEVGDLERWLAALAELTHARIRITPGGSNLPTDDLDTFLAAAGDDHPHLRARVLALLAEADFIAFDYERGQRHADEACALAEEAGDDDLIAFVRFAQGLQHQGRLELEASEESFVRSIMHGDRTPATNVGTWARARLPSARWLRGDLAGAEAAADDAEERAGEVQDWAELSLIAAWRANIAGAAGRFADAELLAERALVRHRRSAYAFTPIVANPALALARALRGDTGGARLALATWQEHGASPFADRLATLVECLGAEPGRAAAVLADRGWRPIRDGALDLRRAGALLAQIEIAAAADDRELLAASRAIFDLHARGVRFVPGSLSLVARLCAVVAGADDVEAGLAWLSVARAECADNESVAEAARCEVDEALLLRRRGAPGDTERAEELLTHASVAFDHLGMLPALRHARHHLGGRREGLPVSGKVILFTDLVDSTSLNVAAGDRAYVELLRAHDRLVRDLLRRHGGVEFKHTGDGIAAWFASGRSAVECALALHERLTGLLLADTGVAVRVRCGLAAGEPIAEGTDLFGLAVSLASRICAAAPPGSVLAEDEVVDRARHPSLRFLPVGEVALKGIPRRIPLFRAERAVADGTRQEPPKRSQLA